MDVPKSQVGFLSFVIRPMISAWSEIMHDHVLSERLGSSIRYWSALQSKQVSTSLLDPVVACSFK